MTPAPNVWFESVARIKYATLSTRARFVTLELSMVSTVILGDDH